MNFGCIDNVCATSDNEVVIQVIQIRFYDNGGAITELPSQRHAAPSLAIPAGTESNSAER